MSSCQNAYDMIGIDKGMEGRRRQRSAGVPKHNAGSFARWGMVLAVGSEDGGV